MRLLLDTHVVLWFALGDPRLSSKARSLIEDPANEKIVSPASYWEIAIKISIGKYALSEPYDTFMQTALGCFPLNRGIRQYLSVCHFTIGIRLIGYSSPRPSWNI
jgi:PIN domain nuclease of toxin-antitoxin system